MKKTKGEKMTEAICKAILEKGMHCSNCGKKKDKQAIWSRGYWWCPECAKIWWKDKEPIIEFPSPGKFVPETITHSGRFEDKIMEELEREIKQLRKDALIMALRLLGEDEETFSPEVKIVMDRWRPIARAALQQANSVFYAASEPICGNAPSVPPE
jgi:hypothetical protein